MSFLRAATPFRKFTQTAMTRLFRRALFACALVLTFSACDQNVATPDDSADVRVSSESGAIIPGRYIVVLEPAAVAGKTVRQVIDAVANDAAAAPDQRCTASPVTSG